MVADCRASAAHDGQHEDDEVDALAHVLGFSDCSLNGDEAVAALLEQKSSRKSGCLSPSPMAAVAFAMVLLQDVPAAKREACFACS